MTDGQSYEDAVARNIVSMRAVRRLTQSELASRMKALGYGWRQQTVGEVENGKRHVTVGEILGLAEALDTGMLQLLDPADPHSPAEPIALPSGAAVLANDVSTLLRGPNNGHVTWDEDNNPIIHPGGYAVRPERRRGEYLARAESHDDHGT